jgi:hypothetical protein
VIVGFTPEKGTAGVRAAKHKSGILLLIGLVLLAGFSVTVILVTNVDSGLLDRGVRAPGVVIAVNQSSKGGWIDVRFGDDHAGTITLTGGSPRYHVDDHVTMIYDPADPGRFRTDIEANDSNWVVALIVFTVLGGLSLGLVGFVEYSCWWRRYREVRKHGWRHGEATITKRGKRRVLDVRFDDGVTVRLMERALRATGIPDRGDVELWVGGAGKRRATLFRGKPFLTAAKVVVR